MSENTGQTQTEAPDEKAVQVRKQLDPGFKRNLFIVFGVFGGSILLMAILFFFRSGDSAKKESGTVDVNVNVSTQQLPDDAELSPALKDSVQKQMELERQEAKKQGEKIHVPQDLTEPVRQIVVKEPSVELPQEPNLSLPPPLPVAPPMSQEEKDRLAKRSAAIERQLGMILASMDAAKLAPARVSFSAEAKPQGSSGGNVLQSETPSGPRTSSQANQTTNPLTNDMQRPFVDSMDIFAGETATAVDTYLSTYSSARILTGKLSGAFLIGKTVQQQEGLRLEYNLMRHNGKTYRIEAIALDEKKSIDAITDVQVDRRYLQRWVFPVATAALGAFANATAQTGSTANASTTGTTTATPPPTVEQARAAGIGAGMKILEREIDKQAVKPYQFTMPERTPIGIMFLAPVLAPAAYR